MITVKTKTNYGRNRVDSIKSNVYFVPVIDGKELNVIAETEDIAFLLGLGRKYDGLNSQFAKMAVRMLGIESAWSE